MKKFKVLTVVLLAGVLSACDEEENTGMKLYESCHVGNEVTVTVTQGFFAKEASVSCTFIKEEESNDK